MSRALAKGRSLDESFDALVCRPLGKRVALALLPSPITANEVTGTAALCGVASGVGFAMPWPGPFFGSLFLFVVMILDCADGELARLRGGGDWRGRLLDGLADFVTAFSVHLGMLLYLQRTGVTVYGYDLSPRMLFFIAFAAGASMAWRCGVVDDVKQRLKDNSIDRDLAPVDPNAGPVDRFLYRLFQAYIGNIRRYSGRRRPGGYTCFRRAQVVGPTHHHLMMVIVGLLVTVSPMAYFAFFVLSIPANLYLMTVLWMAPDLGEGEGTVALTSRIIP